MNWPGQQGGAGNDAGGIYEAGEQLSLGGDEDALPWLESDDDYEEEGSDYRIIFFALAAVLLLGAILFGGYYFLKDDGGTGEFVADGSTIKAPEEPYKVPPEDPGGAEVAGTGDVSFEVGEGQAHEAQLAIESPTPSIDVASSGEEVSESVGVGIQVGAFSSRETARNGWVVLRNRFPALQGLDHRIIEASIDGSTIYRLQAVAGSIEAADSVCRSMKASGGDCQVKR